MAEAKTELIEDERTARAEEKPPEGGPPDRDDPEVSESSPTFHPLIELTLIRLREFWREKEAVFWVFVFPVLMAFALGIAFRNTTPQKLHIAVENTGPTISGPGPTEIYNALARSADIEPSLLSPTDAAQALRSGKVALVVRPASNSARENQQSTNGNQESTLTGREATLSPSPQPLTPNPQPLIHVFDYRYDPTRSESRMARLTVDDALQRGMGRADVTSAADEKVTEPGARYIDFLIPGLIGLNLMGSGIWGIGFAVVSARNRKLLKRFAATPMRRSHYLFSFMMSRLIFLALEVVAIMGFAWLVFGVRIHGSLLSLAVVSIIGGLSFSGIGALLAARPETIEGISGLANFVMLPMWLMSGTFFSSARFPQVLQPFIKALPLTAINDALRAIINEGSSLSANWSQLSVLLIWGLLSFIIALRIFKWK
ncbi:MAG TPA: ABC transporter permease [Pyrinomonadaceae bacterium]|jgi:ABC-type multidrug transport system permease subunit|nr:ABC transporter permease [Pyrinomonadaceae bacterium]